MREKLHPTIAPPPRHRFLNLRNLGTLVQVPHPHMFTVLNPLYRHLLFSYPVKHKRAVRRSSQMPQRLGADLILTFNIYMQGCQLTHLARIRKHYRSRNGWCPYASLWCGVVLESTRCPIMWGGCADLNFKCDIMDRKQVSFRR